MAADVMSIIQLHYLGLVVLHPQPIRETDRLSFLRNRRSTGRLSQGLSYPRYAAFVAHLKEHAHPCMACQHLDANSWLHCGRVILRNA